jgi:hypothetical protein
MTIYRPGQRVLTSGIYDVVTSAGAYVGRQVTSVETRSSRRRASSPTSTATC